MAGAFGGGAGGGSCGCCAAHVAIVESRNFPEAGGPVTALTEPGLRAPSATLSHAPKGAPMLTPLGEAPHSLVMPAKKPCERGCSGSEEGSR